MRPRHFAAFSQGRSVTIDPEFQARLFSGAASTHWTSTLRNHQDRPNRTGVVSSTVTGPSVLFCVRISNRFGLEGVFRKTLKNEAGKHMAFWPLFGLQSGQLGVF